MGAEIKNTLKSLFSNLMGQNSGHFGGILELPLQNPSALKYFPGMARYSMICNIHFLNKEQKIIGCKSKVTQINVTNILCILNASRLTHFLSQLSHEDFGSTSTLLLVTFQFSSSIGYKITLKSNFSNMSFPWDIVPNVIYVKMEFRHKLIEEQLRGLSQQK